MSNEHAHGRLWASEGVQVNKHFNPHERHRLLNSIIHHGSSDYHRAAHVRYLKVQNKSDEIEVKVEMHDSDDEPLNKIIKLSDDVIDIACKEETVKKEIS